MGILWPSNQRQHRTLHIQKCCPTHCANYCAPCQPLLRASSGWIRSSPPTVHPSKVNTPRKSTPPRYRGTSLIKQTPPPRTLQKPYASLIGKRLPLGPYSSRMPRGLGWSYGEGRFFMRYHCAPPLQSQPSPEIEPHQSHHHRGSQHHLKTRETTLCSDSSRTGVPRSQENAHPLGPPQGARHEPTAGS